MDDKKRTIMAVIVFIVVIVAIGGYSLRARGKEGGTGVVRVSISPENQIGINGDTLTYIVTVTNKGNVLDNYSLFISDNDNWNPTILPILLTIPAGENRIATISVTIPNPPNHFEDTIQAKAVSRNNVTIFSIGSCLAGEIHSHPNIPV